MKEFVKINDCVFKTSTIRKYHYDENKNTILFNLDDGSYETVYDVTKDDFIQFFNDMMSGNETATDLALVDKKWELQDMYKYSIDNLMIAIEVMDELHKKYYNDEAVADALEILRDEACKLFGGTLD